MRATTRALALFLVMFVLGETSAKARDFSVEDATIEVPIKIESEQETNAELDSIKQLPIMKSSTLNQEARIIARAEREVYTCYLEKESMLEKNLPGVIENAKSTILGGISRLAEEAMHGCDKKKTKLILQDIAQGYSKIMGHDRLSFGERIALELPKTNSSSHVVTALPEEADPEDNNPKPSELIFMDPVDACKKYSDASNIAGLKKSFDILLKGREDRLTSLMNVHKQYAPRAKKLHDAWETRLNALTNAIEEQSAPATRIADQLAWIIGVFCLFGLLMFFVLGIFKPEVQIELIASGQVIQFATVMVLLIVICVLGISKFLTENTLGTLLGGIGGYVLSQGVGRAVSRAVTRTPPVSVQTQSDVSQASPAE